MNKQPIRVFIADDFLIAREGLKGILDGEDNIKVVGEAITAIEVSRKVNEVKPHVVLMDLKWYGDESAGWSAIRDMKKRQPEVKVIAVTAHENLIKDARLAGADAVLLKTFKKDELVSLVREIAESEVTSTSQPLMVSQKLSLRELDVMRLIVDGRRNEEIGKLLSISTATVKNHVKKIFAKLDVKSRTEAVKVARENGLVK